MEEKDQQKERETSGLDKRERLLEAASQSFSEQGFEAASLRRIAERAAVTFQLIQHHFGNKHDLWLATVDYLFARYLETAEHLEFDPERAPEEQFHAHLGRMMRDTLARAQLRRIAIHEYLADSDRFHVCIKPRVLEFYSSVVLPYFRKVERLGLLERLSARQAALLWGGIVTQNVVSPTYVEYFLECAVPSPEVEALQVDLAFALFTGRPAPRVAEAVRTVRTAPPNTRTAPPNARGRRVHGDPAAQHGA